MARAVRERVGPGEVYTFDGAVDLNGDGRPEVVVYVAGPMVCGTGGCNLLVYSPQGDGYRRVADIRVTRVPVRAARASTNGWRHLVVRVAGGGAASGDVELVPDGSGRYPSNPTVPGPRVRPATGGDTELLIADFQSMREGTPLPEAGAVPTATAASAAPSFDCARATRDAERLICRDTELAALDRALAKAYAKGLTPTSDGPDADRQASRAAQRTWLAERDRCAKAPDARDCVASAYRRRLVELQIRNGDAGPVPRPFTYLCDGQPGAPVQVVYYGETDPKAAVITLADGRQAIVFVAPSGSGARYVGLGGVELWEHHGEATLTWGGQRLTCRAS